MPHTTLVDLLRWRAEHQPNQIGYTFLTNGDEVGSIFTYCELDRQARVIGAYLQQAHAYDERVLLLYPPGLEFIAGFFGCLYAGAIAVPAYPPRYHRQLSRIPAIVADAQAKFVLTTEHLHERIAAWFKPESGSPSLQVIAADQLADDLETLWQPTKISGNHLAFLQYTSGSTATPKGVMVSHHNLLHNLAMVYTCFEHTPSSVVVSWLPLYHDMGLIGGILQPFFGGFPTILMSPAAFIQQPARWLRAISTYRATTSGGPNFGYELCLSKITPEQRAALDLSSWDLAFNGAEPVHHETFERFSAAFAPCGFRYTAFYPCYGLAEATLFVSGGKKTVLPVIRTFQQSALECHQIVETTGDALDARTLAGCGQTTPDQTIMIVDPQTLTPCAVDQVGEIWVTGPGVTQGYWNRPEETEKIFRGKLTPWSPLLKRKGEHDFPSPLRRGARGEVLLPSPSGRGDGGEGNTREFLRTGDLGFIKDGELFITGRLKDLIIIRGRNHYPEDIEWRVEHCHPLLKKEDCAVFTVNITGAERLVVAAEVEPQHWDRRCTTRSEIAGADDRRRPAQFQSAIPRASYVEEAIACIRQVVSDYHELHVHAIVLLKAGTLPKTSSGKIQRHACRARYLEGTLQILASSIMDAVTADPDFSRIDREEVLAKPPTEQRRYLETYLIIRIAAVLHVDPTQISRQQRLSSLGLDSLMAVELQHRLEAEFGFNWPITTFLSSTNIAELVEESVTQLHATSGEARPAIIATHRTGKMPLSYNQQALWFLHRLDPPSVAYHVPFILRIRSKIDSLALQRVFQQLVIRHAMLRTTYHDVHGELFQNIHEDLPVRFETITAGAWSEADIQATVLELVRQPFDLTQGSVMRITLLTRMPDDHLLVITFHHIAIDFWSLLIILDELRTVYPAERTGVLSQLPQQIFSYADFVHWQAEMLHRPEGEHLWAYWQKQLSGELPILNLPTDRPRPPVQTYAGASLSFTLDAELTRRLQTIARMCDATLYMTLLAAFQVLLYRYTGQEDMLVGSPAANRKFSGFDETVGYFVNPLILRADLSGNPEFFAFLRQVRHTVLDALEHQEYPFPLLVERLKLRRDASRSPGFQVMFVMQEPHRLEAAAPFALREAGASIYLGGLQIESYKVDFRIAQFDLTLMVVNTADGLMGAIEYNTDLFDPATMQRMAGHFQTLLHGIVVHPEQRVAELPILTEAERQQILVAWNNTEIAYPEDKCLHELFEAQVQKTPNAVAVVEPETHPPTPSLPKRGGANRSLTYHELNCRANQLAHYLRKLGVGPEILVGICLERSLEMVIGLLGILKAGGAYVPLDPEYPKERLAFMLHDSRTPVLLSQQSVFDRFPEHQAHVVCLDLDWEQIAQESEENPEHIAKPDHLAYVIYTSGSTGRPKGVLIEHQAIARHTLCIQDHYALTSADRVLQFASLSFDTSLEQIFPSLLAGARVIVRGQRIWSPTEIQQHIREHAITVINLPPAYWQQLSREAVNSPHTFPSNSLRLMIVGGDVMTPEALDTWRQLPTKGIRLLNAYGPTETTITALTYEIRLHLRQRVPIGHPLPDRSVYIVDHFGNPVPVGVTGELCIGGKGLARGYLNHPKLTQEKFIPDPFSGVSGSRLYKTGDLAHYLPDGNIEFLERIDQQVKIRGSRIETGEIETVLTEHPAVRAAAVIVREVQPGEKRLAAYLVLKLDTGIQTPEIRRYLQTRLPEYMIPAAFVVLDALPLTPTGKIDRRALPAPDRTAQQGTYQAPGTEIEAALVRIWSETLQVERVGIHDNFFELGGDSILSLRIIARARQAGIQLTPKDMLIHQTIAELAAVAGAMSLTPTDQEALSGTMPLTPIQHWFFEQRFAEAHHWNQAVLLAFERLPTLDRFEHALQQLVWQHDALRLRFVHTAAGWQQAYTECQANLAVIRIDIAGVSEPERAAVCRAEASQLQASMDLSEAPLLRAALFDAGPGTPGYALLIIHHLVVDGVSWRILLEDLHRLLTTTSESSPVIELPAKTASYQQWAHHLVQHAQSETTLTEGEYWLTSLQKISFQPFQKLGNPGASPSQDALNTVASAEHVLVELNAEQTRALVHAVPPVYHTRIEEVLLTALAQTLSQWTGQQHVLFDLESHGRDTDGTSLDLSRTVGWFTSVFPVVLTIERADPGEVLKSVKEQLRQIPRQSVGYGVARYLHSDALLRQRLQSLPQADVAFNYLGQMEFGFAAFTPIVQYANDAVGPLRSPHGHRTHVLELNSFIAGQQFRMVWTYSRAIHDRTVIERLAGEYIAALQRLIDHCRSPEAGGYTPSDFPAARLNQQQLAKILKKLKKE